MHEKKFYSLRVFACHNIAVCSTYCLLVRLFRFCFLTVVSVISNGSQSFEVGYGGRITNQRKLKPVSYTHLDVYKRQALIM